MIQVIIIQSYANHDHHATSLGLLKIVVQAKSWDKKHRRFLEVSVTKKITLLKVFHVLG